MSSQNPYEQLGVTTDASFEEIQEARVSLKQQYQGDQKSIDAIEAAYDAIIMDRLKLRQEGRIKVPDAVRFPEKTVEPKASQPAVSMPSNTPAWLQNLWDRPSWSELAWSSGIFTVLAAWVVLDKSGAALSLVIALGFAASVYLINRKENRFGRAFVITLIALLLGLGLGSLLGNAFGGVPLRANEIATVLTLILMWVISNFCR
jgi:hypothetical protein